MELTPFLKVIFHIFLGLSFSYMYQLIKGKTIYKRIILCFFYISSYFLLLDRLFLTTHYYLIIILAISFILGFKYHIFYPDIYITNILFKKLILIIKKILSPPILKDGFKVIKTYLKNRPNQKHPDLF